MSEFLSKVDARRSRILEAALVEFAEKGYKKASTNTIVREAKVSKGLLFHYFISKKDLYIYIFKHAKETIQADLNKGVNFADKDVLNRLFSATQVVVDSYMKHKLFGRILEKHEFVEDEEIIKMTKSISKQINEDCFTEIYQTIDYYAFKDSIDIERSLLTMKFTIDRLKSDWKDKHQSKYTKETLEELKIQVYHYLDLFKDAFYR